MSSLRIKWILIKIKTTWKHLILKVVICSNGAPVHLDSHDIENLTYIFVKNNLEM
jgi:hypothetical protein